MIVLLFVDLHAEFSRQHTSSIDCIAQHGHTDFSSTATHGHHTHHTCALYKTRRPALLNRIQPYLLAITWAIAGIAAKKGYRREQLGDDVGEGIDEALQGLWIGLLCVGVLGIIVGARQRNRTLAGGEKGMGRRPTPSAPRSEGNGLTSAIFSS